MIGIVYKISNSIDGRVYIGSSINYLKREKEHINDLKNNKHHNIHLQRFCNKYGLDKLRFEIIDTCWNDVVLIREQYYLDTTDNLFNISDNATAPMTNKKHTKASKKLISIASSGKNNGMYGKERPKWLINKMHKHRWDNVTKKEKVMRQINAPLRKEIIISKEGEEIRCMSYAHAAKIIQVSYQSIEKSINENRFKCKGWEILVCSDKLYTEKFVMGHLELFSDTDWSPQPKINKNT